MKKENIQKEIIDKIAKCQKEFEAHLKNNKVMFVYENKDKTIDKEEMIFPVSCFYHLTGIRAYDKKHNLLNSYSFYELLKRNRINAMNLEFKDRTTFYKLEILQQLMRIDRNAQMIGNFCGRKYIFANRKNSWQY